MKNKKYEKKKTMVEHLDRAQQWRSITNHLLGELDGPGVGVDVGGLEAGESGGAGELPELPLVPLLAAGVVGEHDHVDVEHPLLPRRRVGALRQHALHHHHLPVLRQRVVAVLEQPRAVLVAPVVEDPLHQDGVAAAGHGGEHVAADVLHPGERRRLGDDVGEVVVDPPDVRVAGDDGGHSGAHAAADVDDGGGGVEAGVEVEQLLGDDDGVVLHALVEDAVEAGVRAVVLERRHPVRLVERDAAVQDCVLKVVPALHEDLVLVHEGEGGHGDAVLVGRQPLAHRRGGVAAGELAVGALLHLAPDDVVGGEQAEHAVHHVGRRRVRLGRQLVGHLRRRQQRRLPPSSGDGGGLQRLEQAQLDGVLERHRQDRRRRQLQRVHARLLVGRRGHVGGCRTHPS